MNDIEEKGEKLRQVFSLLFWHHQFQTILVYVQSAWIESAPTEWIEIRIENEKNILQTDYIAIIVCYFFLCEDHTNKKIKTNKKNQRKRRDHNFK